MKWSESSKGVDAEQPPSHSRRWVLVWLLLLGVLSAIYWPTFSYEPVVDDPAQIVWVQDFDSFSEVFGIDSSGLFRPVKNIAFYLFARDGDLFDLRIASLILFAAFGVAYYLFACRFLQSNWALFTALLVVLHPAQVASAIFPSAINNIFSGIFILLYCYTALAYLENERSSRSAVPMLIVFGMLALFGYELAVVIVPLSVLFVFYCRHSAPPLKSITLLVLSILLVVAYLLARGQENAINEMTHPMIPPSATSFDLFCSAPYYTLKHLGMAVFPLGQGGVLLVDDPRGGLVGELPYWILLGSLLLVACWYVERWRSRWALGLLFFIFAMTPLSNWIPLRNGPLTNYYLLLPICGLALALGVLFEKYSKCSRSRLCSLLAGGLLVVSAAGGAYRASWWSSQYSIYEFTVRNHTENWLAWNNWGVALAASGENADALEAFGRSAALAEWYVEPLENQMWLLLIDGRSEAVVDLLEERGARISSGLAAAATIAYATEGDRSRALEWGQQVDSRRLRPAQAKWFDRVFKSLQNE